MLGRILPLTTLVLPFWLVRVLCKTRETIAVWVREDADYVRGALGPEGGARILADTDRHYASARPIWDRLLGNIISLMQ